MSGLRPDVQRLAPRLTRIRIAPQQHRMFRFNVTPPIWTAYVDGRAVSRRPGTPLWAKLGPGRHVVEFRHPSVWPLRFVVGPTDPGRALQAQLRFRPATLLVRVAPREARARFVFLAPRWLARRGSYPVNLPLKVRLGTRVRDLSRVRIRVYAVGYRHEDRQVQMAPGERTVLPVLIRPLVNRFTDDELARR